jgi:hypothetical protein
MAGEPEFSGAWRTSDAFSARGQRLHFRLLRVELGFVVLGALLGVISNDASRVSAAVSFGAAIVMRAGRMRSNPVKDWYDGRAAAESAKTLCWRYAVGAAPFDLDTSAAEVDAMFGERLRDVVKASLESIPPSKDGTPAGQITEWMRVTRRLPLEQRKEVYRRHRIEDQYDWYGARAASATRTGRRWSFAVLGLECLGVALAVLSVLDLDLLEAVKPGALLGVVASLIAAAAAWTQARQYGNLASAYSMAQLELSTISDLLPVQREESDWSGFVDSAEGAISREHTTWRASRTGGAD